MYLGGGGSDLTVMLFVTGVFAASVVAASAAAAASDLLPHDPVDGDPGRAIDRRADGYAMAWRKGKRFGFGAADGPALYRGRYAFPPLRERKRQAILYNNVVGILLAWFCLFHRP